MNHDSLLRSIMLQYFFELMFTFATLWQGSEGGALSAKKPALGGLGLRSEGRRRPVPAARSGALSESRWTDANYHLDALHAPSEHDIFKIVPSWHSSTYKAKLFLICSGDIPDFGWHCSLLATLVTAVLSAGPENSMYVELALCGARSFLVLVTEDRLSK